MAVNATEAVRVVRRKPVLLLLYVARGINRHVALPLLLQSHGLSALGLRIAILTIHAHPDMVSLSLAHEIVGVGEELVALT